LRARNKQKEKKIVYLLEGCYVATAVHRRSRLSTYRTVFSTKKNIVYIDCWALK